MEIRPELIHQFYHSSVHGRVVHWDNIKQGDTCAPYEVIGFADKDIDINGAADGGTIAFQGANHPVNPVYSVVKDNANDAITAIGAGGHFTVINHVFLVKPVLTGGGASTDFDVTMILYNAV